jgi:hypothetical protein
LNIKNIDISKIKKINFGYIDKNSSKTINEDEKKNYTISSNQQIRVPVSYLNRRKRYITQNLVVNKKNIEKNSQLMQLIPTGKNTFMKYQDLIIPTNVSART